MENCIRYEEIEMLLIYGGAKKDATDAALMENSE